MKSKSPRRCRVALRFPSSNERLCTLLSLNPSQVPHVIEQPAQQQQAKHCDAHVHRAVSSQKALCREFEIDTGEQLREAFGGEAVRLHSNVSAEPGRIED